MRNFMKLLMAGTMAIVAAITPAAAEAPSGPVTIVVPFPAGGSTDAVARMVGDKAGEILGVPVQVENRPGGATTPATIHVIRSRPDGRTLFFAGNSGILNPYLREDAPFSLLKDLKPVSLLATASMLLVVKSDNTAQTVADVIKEAQANPGKYQIGIPGLGSVNHMTLEAFKRDAGIDVVMVPFQGGAQQITALLGGVVSVAFDNYTTSAPQIESGALRALAVTSKNRIPMLPDVPTIAEAGLPGFDTDYFTSIYAPKDTPDNIVATLSEAFDEALKDPSIKDRLAKMGFEAAGGTPEVMDAYARDQDSRWSKFITENNLQLQ
jgi:tripartite-type tricarboxylate transporter receptor subunit TctC